MSIIAVLAILIRSTPARYTSTVTSEMKSVSWSRELFQHSACKEFPLTFWGMRQHSKSSLRTWSTKGALYELSDTATHDPVCIHKPMA